MNAPEQIRAWVTQLEREYEHFCFAYRSKLRRPVIRVNNEKSRWGQWDPVTRTLTLSQRLIETQPWAVVLEILKHEMAHQWVTEKDLSDEGHGPLFRLACQRFGVADWACQSVTDPSLPLEAWREAFADPERARLQGRVEKLLALAGSSNQHEATAAMKKVQELYARHNLETLESGIRRDYVSREISSGKKRMERHHFLIASILNDYFFVRVIHASRFDAKANTTFKMIEILGTRTNVDMAEYVYHFLWNQIQLRWKLFRSETGASVRGKSSYFLGLLTEFRKKLEVPAVESDSLALQIKEDPRLTSFVRDRYPRLASFGRSGMYRDRESFKAGQQEGKRLTLYRGVGKSDGFLGRLLSRNS